MKREEIRVEEIEMERRRDVRKEREKEMSREELEGKRAERGRPAVTGH